MIQLMAKSINCSTWRAKWSTQIGPWNGERPAAPEGVWFACALSHAVWTPAGQGPMGVLGQDPMGGKVIPLQPC